MWCCVHVNRRLVYAGACNHDMPRQGRQIMWILISAIYIGEISHKNLRNRLGSIPSQFLAVGYLISYILGYLSGWRTTSFISAGISVLAAFLPLILPETPYWLIEHNMMKEAQ